MNRLGTRFGKLLLCFTTPVCAGAICVAAPPNCQFVGQVPPLPMVSGNPLVQRARPERLQPPMMASVRRFEFVARYLPFPNGSSKIKFELIWWVVSKSEVPRCWLGTHELMMFPLMP